MPMNVAFTLSDADLDRLRGAMDAVRARADGADAERIATAARALIERSPASDAPEFVRDRLREFATLIEMLRDTEWNLSGPARERVLAGLAYFAEPADLIPDGVPGLGFLDDAVIAELVVRDLRHELEAYREFCAQRARQRALRPEEPDAKRAEWLAAERRRMFARIERRREERARHISHEPLVPRILRYQ
jgi:uncharacterized membrane protein YkvA (DUF1232 family)